MRVVVFCGKGRFANRPMLVRAVGRVGA